MKTHNQKILILFALFALRILLSAVIANAIVISNVDVSSLYPGDETDMTISVENTLDSDVSDASLTLNFEKLPFSSAGSSTYDVDEIEEDDEEIFHFRIRASPNAEPGDFNIPYTLTYDGLETPKTGTIGIIVSGNVELDFSVSEENPITGEKGKIKFIIVNKGLAEAKFLSVKINPSGYTLLSEEEIYVGTISPDDFETIEMDVIFGSKPTLNAVIEYKNFENKEVSRTVSLPVKVYTKEKAVALGIAKQNYNLVYALAAAIAIVLIIIYRTIRKRKKRMQARKRLEMQSAQGS